MRCRIDAIIVVRALSTSKSARSSSSNAAWIRITIWFANQATIIPTIWIILYVSETIFDNSSFTKQLNLSTSSLTLLQLQIDNSQRATTTTMMTLLSHTLLRVNRWLIGETAHRKIDVAIRSLPRSIEKAVLVSNRRNLWLSDFLVTDSEYIGTATDFLRQFLF